MSKKIKVIDLLNMIAKGEEVPKKIKHLKQIYKLYEYYEDTGLIKYENDVDFYVLDLINCLNDTVEIIEEQPEIDIQSMREVTSFGIKQNQEAINELIRAVKQLDKRTANK